MLLHQSENLISPSPAGVSIKFEGEEFKKKSTRLKWKVQSTFDAAQLHAEMDRCPSLRKCHSVCNQGKNWTWGSHLPFINPLCFTAGVSKDWGKKKMGRGKGDIKGYNFCIRHLSSHSSHYLPIFVLTCTGWDTYWANEQYILLLQTNQTLISKTFWYLL